MNQNLQDEITNRTNADTTLQTNIDTVATDLAGEITDRQNADTTLQTNIDAVATDLTTEITNRQNADTTLQTNIDNLSTDLSTNYSTTAVNNGLYYLNTTALNAITAPSASVSLNSQKITNLATPTTGSDGATKAYVDQAVGGGSLPITATLDLIATENPNTQNVPFNNFKITGLAQGTQNGDSIEYSQLQTTNTNLNDLATDLNTNYSTTTNMNTAITTALVPYSTTTTNDSKYYWSSNLPSKIQHSSANSSLDCSGANRIDIKANGNSLGYFFQPTGQATTPLGLLTNDKLQLQSGMNSLSFYGNNVTPVNGLVYSALRSQCTDVPTSNCYTGIETGPSGSTSLNGNLTLVAGHANILGDGV